MHRRIARTALFVLALAAGVAGSSAAHPAKDRSCGEIRDSGGVRIGVVVQRGAVRCATAKKVVRAYDRSTKPCTGSACVRPHHGFACTSAKPDDFPRLFSCSKGRLLVAAMSTAD
jgi:hypothetical protein